MAKKSLIFEVGAEVGNAVSGAAKVKDAIGDMLKGAEGAEGRITQGAAQAIGGLKNSLTAAKAIAEEVIGLAKSAIEMAQFAGEWERLSASVSPVRLAGLREATRGLVDDLTLMRIAAKGSKGDFALTAEELEMLGRAAFALHQRGGLGTVPEIFERITGQLAEGKVGKLDDFGISLEGIKDKGEQAAIALEKFRTIGEQGAGLEELTNTGDRATQKLVKFKNEWDEFKVKAGQALMDTVDWLGEVGDSLDITQGLLVDLEDPITAFARRAEEAATGMNSAAAAAERLAKSQRDAMLAQATAEAQSHEEDRRRAEKQANQQIQQRRADAAREAAKAARDMEREADEAWNSLVAVSEKWYAFSLNKQEERRRKAAEAELEEFRELQKQKQRIIEAHNAALADSVGQATRDLEKSLFTLSRAFEKQGRTTKTWGEELKESGTRAFDGFANAAGNAFAMVIAGQEGAKDAFFAGLQQMLIGEATHMGALAIKELGMAFAALARYQLDAATNHFTAAAILAGGAAAYGVGGAIAGSFVSAPAGADQDGAGGAANSNTAGQAGMASGGGGTTIVERHFHLGYGFIGNPRELARAMRMNETQAEDRGDIRTRIGRRAA